MGKCGKDVEGLIKSFSDLQHIEKIKIAK